MRPKLLLLLVLALASAPLHPQDHPRFLVVIDPAHGGDDGGARLAPDRFEKDVNLELARRLEQVLLARQIDAVLLRNSDVSLSPDERAAAANRLHPALFLSLHATSGNGIVRVYTVPAEKTPPAALVSWKSANSAWAAGSETFAADLLVAAADHSTRMEVKRAHIPTLPSVMAPAVAIENDLRAPQRALEDTIAAAIASLRGASR